MAIGTAGALVPIGSTGVGGASVVAVAAAVSKAVAKICGGTGDDVDAGADVAGAATNFEAVATGVAIPAEMSDSPAVSLNDGPVGLTQALAVKTKKAIPAESKRDITA
ncbi:MAG: hypothetical protein QGI84_07325 [Dehalococcoidia bacterium]|nr:hypothetical protein [Dehalococcoidia bacterium]